MRDQRYGNLAGFLMSACALGVMLAFDVQQGEPIPPRLEAPQFSVAVLRGARQAAQTAPENVTEVVEAVQVSAAAPATKAPAVADREASLPEAVRAAPVAAVEAPKPEVVQPVEVAPPARVSMPGGRLVMEDAPPGDSPDPFTPGPRQVYLRLTVNAEGKVVSGAIVRPGPEPWRDALILRAMRSRTYSTDNLQQMPSAERQWQLEMTVPYGRADDAP